MLIERLVRIRHFPPVVHPGHARELLAGGDAEAVAGWTGGYAVTTVEHRRLLEELLGGLGKRQAGQAALVNGLYGTGKSHLLVLLHLLLAHPPAWEPFLETHPEFRRYREPLSGHRPLVVHFSLDEYGTKGALEEVVLREVTRTVGELDLAGTDSRLDAWTAIMDACRAGGYDGLALLVDELSLFLAGKSPAKREADAAFLQFLAGWTGRAPVWFLAAMQRTLSDVGPLRAHSWRQVEDRFRRYTLSPQQIGDVLREKLIVRIDPAAVRALVAERIVPAAAEVRLPAGELQTNWPFHPATIDLIMAVVNGHLSPHRSAVEVFQRIEKTDWLQRSPERLITPLDLFSLLTDDLRNHAQPEQLWRAADLLQGCAASAPDPALARQLIDLLLLLHLAERPTPVAQLRALLFDGVTAPEVAAISANLHALRRHGAYLAVSRDADPAAETFLLAIDDEAGALARGYMLEMRQEMAADDPRVVELALQACADPAWPFNGAEGSRAQVSWYGSERPVRLSSVPDLTPELVTRHFEGLLAGQAAGAVLLLWPGVDGLDCWHRATAGLAGPYTGTYLLWQPREATAAERDLWLEYAAWERAATAPVQPAGARERRARARCRERADELRPAVTASIRRLFVDGRWHDARGNEGKPGGGASPAEMLADALAAGFDALFPLFPSSIGNGLPSRAAVHQLLTQVIEPGEARLAAQSLPAEYVERYLLSLGCAEFDGVLARVTPPRWEILEPLLDRLTGEPLRLADAVEVLQRPPVGLTAEQARLVIFSAVRVGAAQGLDGFLQPLDPTTTALARSDALAFVGPPLVADERFRPLILALAARWALPVEPWPVACSQLEHYLRGWQQGWAAQLSATREALAEWGALLAVLPWQWKATDNALSRLERLLEAQPPTLEETLALIGDDAAWLDALEAVREAVSWWQAHRERIALLLSLTADDTVRSEIEVILGQLAQGEECFAARGEIGERIDAVQAVYRESYQRRHEELFGAPVVAALRGVFESAEFRAVKALSRLPLPPPEAASRCLDALAQARTQYCPGVFTRLDADGVCAKCRLPYGSASPMPDAAAVRQWAAEALREYVTLLKTHPWTAGVRDRLPRASEEIIADVRVLLSWRTIDDPQMLITLLHDDALLAWLCRDRPAAGVRRVEHFQQRLAHRDLTLQEAREEFTRWLDPEQSLEEEAVLTFE